MKKRCYHHCITRVCPRQGREILKMLEELPSKNVSVRLVTSVPSVRTNSTDLKVLKKKGLKGAPLFLAITFPPLF